MPCLMFPPTSFAASAAAMLTVPLPSWYPSGTCTACPCPKSLRSPRHYPASCRQFAPARIERLPRKHLRHRRRRVLRVGVERVRARDRRAGLVVRRDSLRQLSAVTVSAVKSISTFVPYTTLLIAIFIRLL